MLLLLRQYLYFCTSKDRKLLLPRQYLCFCTRKARKEEYLLREMLGKFRIDRKDEVLKMPQIRVYALLKVVLRLVSEWRQLL